MSIDFITPDKFPPQAAQVTQPATDSSLVTPGGPTARVLARPDNRLAYSVKEAAILLGVSEKSIRRLIDRGLIRVSRALRHLLIPRKEIERFLESTTLD